MSGRITVEPSPDGARSSPEPGLRIRRRSAAKGMAAMTRPGTLPQAAKRSWGRPRLPCDRPVIQYPGAEAPGFGDRESSAAARKRGDELRVLWDAWNRPSVQRQSTSSS